MKKKKKSPRECAFARIPVKEQRPTCASVATDESRRAWNDVLTKIHAAKEALDVRANEDWWFRGQVFDVPLSPSLFRLLDGGFNDQDENPKSIYELEYDLYFDFSCRAPGMQEPGLTSWDKLSHMRHHGLPTRLLDWTERLGVALFFAVSGPTAATTPRVLWILSPCLLNEMVLGDRDLYSPKYLGYDHVSDEFWDYEDYLVFDGGTFDWEGPVAIYPEQKNSRMRSQLGWFTIFGENTNALEVQFPPAKNPKLLQRIEIPHEAIPAAKEFLAEAGIDEFAVYPDIDGFCGFLKSHYGVPR